MKQPQCTTAADCLEELARVMRQFQINDVWKAVGSRYVKEHSSKWDCSSTPAFNEPRSWQFAIAEVEGRAVFIGDELYHNGEKFVITGQGDFNYTHDWSWLPPAPKTGMIELPMDVIEYWAHTSVVSGASCIGSIPTACKAFLDKQREQEK